MHFQYIMRDDEYWINQYDCIVTVYVQIGCNEKEIQIRSFENTVLLIQNAISNIFPIQKVVKRLMYQDIDSMFSILCRNIIHTLTVTIKTKEKKQTHEKCEQNEIFKIQM